MFYENLKALCSAHGTTPTAMAKEIGISTSMTANWKKGGMPRGDTLQKIAKYFGVGADALLGEREEPQAGAIRIPVFGDVAGGVPIEAVTDIEEYEEISPSLAAAGEFFALRVKGHSMEPRIWDGDVVIVRRQESADNGDVAVVLVGNESATCKKIKKTPEGVLLVSLNPAFDPMFFTGKEIADLPLRVLGKVVEVRGKI